MVTTRPLRPMSWLLALAVTAVLAACQGEESAPTSAPATDASSSAEASPSAESGQEFCSSMVNFLATVGYMGNIEVLGFLGETEPEEVAQDLQSSAESVIVFGADLEPLAPDDINGDVLALVEAAGEITALLADGGSASDGFDIWSRPEVEEAQAAVQDYYDNSSCAPSN